MNALSEARAEANAAERLVCLLAFEIAKLNKFLGERRGSLDTLRQRTGANGLSGACGAGNGVRLKGLSSDGLNTQGDIELAALKEVPVRAHAANCTISRGSVRPLPPLTDTETLPPSRCQREAVRQHKPRNGLASPSAGDEHG